MKKRSLNELMHAYAAKRREDEHARSLALFLTYRDDIRELHKNGWTYADIWRAMYDEKIIPFSYASFTRFARRFRENTQPTSPPSAASNAPDMPALPGWPKPNQNQNQGNIVPIAPGSTRVDIPVLGKNRKPRDPNSF